MRRTRVRGVPLSGETLGVDNLYPNDILGLVISTDSSSPDIWSLITSDVELTATCERWSVAGIIGVDTEFVRERTYYPCPALIQVADNHGVVIIDPLGISDFSPLKDVLIDPSILKLTHACDEDLEVLEFSQALRCAMSLIHNLPVHFLDTASPSDIGTWWKFYWMWF